MNEQDILKTYTLDYVGRYHFYEDDEFVQVVQDGEYILENLKKSNRFDYNKASYKFTKFGNISEGITTRNVTLTIIKDSVNVKLDDEEIHLDLIYKMDVKELEDHYRVTTRISEKHDKSSVLLYINKEDGEECVEALKEVRKYQQKLFDEGLNERKD